MSSPVPLSPRPRFPFLNLLFPFREFFYGQDDIVYGCKMSAVFAFICPMLMCLFFRFELHQAVEAKQCLSGVSAMRINVFHSLLLPGICRPAHKIFMN